MSPKIPHDMIYASGQRMESVLRLSLSKKNVKRTMQSDGIQRWLPHDCPRKGDRMPSISRSTKVYSSSSKQSSVSLNFK